MGKVDAVSGFRAGCRNRINFECGIVVECAMVVEGKGEIPVGVRGFKYPGESAS